MGNTFLTGDHVFFESPASLPAHLPPSLRNEGKKIYFETNVKVHTRSNTLQRAQPLAAGTGRGCSRLVPEVAPLGSSLQWPISARHSCVEAAFFCACRLAYRARDSPSTPPYGCPCRCRCSLTQKKELMQM